MLKVRLVATIETTKCYCRKIVAVIKYPSDAPTCMHFSRLAYTTIDVRVSGAEMHQPLPRAPMITLAWGVVDLSFLDLRQNFD